MYNSAKVYLGDFKWQFVGAEGIVGTNRPRAQRVTASMLRKVASKRDLPDVLGFAYTPKQNEEQVDTAM